VSVPAVMLRSSLDAGAVNRTLACQHFVDSKSLG
jgi:hypothetical protein